MKKTKFISYLFLVFFIFLSLSVSYNFQNKIKEMAISSIYPFSKSIENIKFLCKKQNTIADKNLALENTILKNQKEKVYEWLMFDQRIEEQFQKLKKVSKEPINKMYWKNFFIRRNEQLKNILEEEILSIPANIVFRSFSSWNSSVWLDIGSNTNNILNRKCVGKNSPVVFQDSLVGVIEYVGKKFSRVRLITDSGLVASVRAVRGKEQDANVAKALKLFLDIFSSRNDLLKKEEKEKLITSLSNILKRLQKQNIDLFLAKGEICGCSSFGFRSNRTILKGRGFNLHFEDDKSPARDLNGRAYNDKFLPIPILQKGDLLITTGMDGIFPKGLKAGVVSKIKKIKEGDFFYDIEAISTICLDDLHTVFVMPPIGFDEN